jgi:hypothetical protein
MALERRIKDQIHNKLQAQLILSQLAALRREFREALHAYEARLEITVAEVANEFAALKKTKRLSREQVDRIDKVVALLRKRKLKPEKGRRKDLRKIEKLINDLRATAFPSIR